MQKYKITDIVIDEDFEYKHERFTEVIIFLEGGSKLHFGISNFGQCCEYFGFIECNEFTDYKKFIGANILKVSNTRPDSVTNLNIEDFEKEFIIENEYCEFIRITTDKGVLCFTVYNEHNGYYGHNIITFFQKENGEIEHTETFI